MGSIRVLEGAHHEGLALCRKAVEFRANCPFALGQLAFAETYFGSPEAAVGSARSALAIRLLYPPPIVNILAIAYRDSGRIDSSLSAALEAVRLAPDHVDPLVTLCSVQMMKNNKSGAAETAARIKKIHPDFSVVRYLATQPYRQRRKLSDIGDALHAAGLK